MKITVNLALNNFVIMAQRYLHPFISLVLALTTAVGFSQTSLVSSTFIASTPALALNLFSPFNVEYDIEFYKITYNTVDVDGTPTVASGMVVFPQEITGTQNCDSLPMISYCHGTVLEDDNVPSRNNFESILGKLFSGIGYVTVMPDYLGLGDHPGIHPYVHAESQATATIDAMRAAKELMAQLGKFEHNGQVFLTGYSQGGHAAMATHKYIQDNGLYNEFNVVASAPCSGPYNMSGAQSDPLLSGDPYDSPGYVIYLLMSYELAYGNIYNNLSDVLQSPYDTLIPPLFDGNNDMDAVNAILPPYLDSFLVDTFLFNFRSDSVGRTHPLWVALEDNDNYDWTPERPVRMYYCTADEQVFFENSLLAESTMLANGATDIKAINRGNLDHGGCVTPALEAAAIYFDSLKVLCSTPTSVNEIAEQLTDAFEVYPNPVTETVSFTGEETPATVLFYTLSGQLMGTYIPQTNVVNISWFPAGVYIIKATDNKGHEVVRQIIKQ